MNRLLESRYAYVWFAAGALLFVFSNGRWTVPAAAWLAPVFLIRFTQLRRPSTGLAVLFLFIALAARIMLHEIVPTAPGFLTYLLILYYSLLWFIPYLVNRLFSNKLKGFHATLIFPLAGVTVEHINTLLFGSWGATAYTQTGNLPLLQMMSVTGMWGVTFVVLWFGSVVNLVLENYPDIQRERKWIGLYAGIVCVILLFGGARLALNGSDSQTVRIASFTPSAQIEKYYEDRKEIGFSSTTQMASQDRQSLRALLAVMHQSMFDRTRQEMIAGAELVMWPEFATRVLEENESQFLAAASALAKEEGSSLLLAYNTIPLSRPGFSAENKSVLIDSTGEIRWTYLKSYPVPGSTDKAGDKIIPVADLPFAKVGSAICYDMDFTGLIHQAGRKDADILLVPAWDWRAINPLHAVMAAFRAIENGFSMVRQTGEGLSIAVDPYGRVLASMDYFRSKDQVMVALVPTKGVRTVYSYIGDAFAWMCIGALVLLITFCFRSP